MRLRGRLWLTLPILAAAYVLLVLGAARWLGGERIDLTHDHLYTLSPGTRDIAAHLRQGDLLPGGVLYEDTLAGRLKQDKPD